MNNPNPSEPKKIKVLTCNSHESYVWSLAQVDIKLDIIDELPGRYTKSWDTNMRPVPASARLISIEEALGFIDDYDCFIGHNIDDLLLLKKIKMPKILLLHDSLAGYQAQEKNQLPQEQVQHVLRTYMDRINGTAVAISEMKMEAWGLEGTIIPHYVDTDYFSGYRGSIRQGLRVANQFTAKGKILKADFHHQITQHFPVKLIGFNPDIDDSLPSKNMSDLREYYRDYRYYLHTAQPGFEDGYNLASLEAMAVGMPVVCNYHPSAPIENGVNGYISSDPSVLKHAIVDLLSDLDLAQELGKAGRDYVQKHHGFAAFNQKWLDVIKNCVDEK